MGDDSGEFRDFYPLYYVTDDYMTCNAERLRKDGSEGAIVDLPSVETMQRDEKFREKWIAYSACEYSISWLHVEVVNYCINVVEF